MLLGRLVRRHAAWPASRRSAPMCGAWWASRSRTRAHTALSCSSRAPRGPARSRPSRAGEKRVRRFAAEHDTRELRLVRVRMGWPIIACSLARRARRGRGPHPTRGPGAGGRDGRLLHSLGPQGPGGATTGADRQGPGCATWWRAASARVALYAGDDVTDLDAFDALDALEDEARIDTAVRWAEPGRGTARHRRPGGPGRGRRARVRLRAHGASPTRPRPREVPRLPARGRAPVPGPPPRWPWSRLEHRARTPTRSSTSPRSGGVSPHCAARAAPARDARHRRPARRGAQHQRAPGASSRAP